MTDISKWNEMFLRNSAGSDITFLDCLFDVFTFWKQHLHDQVHRYFEGSE